MESMFRNLNADEIDVRVSRVTNAGVELLLYKDSRCDMRILDEQVGSENWKNDFKDVKGVLYGGVAIRTDGEWIWKWNAGSPSNMEAAKGEASDALKRSCFMWGIGRELYTAPRIFVYADRLNSLKPGKSGRMQCYDSFSVEKIMVEDGRITAISIMNDSTGKRCFVWKKGE